MVSCGLRVLGSGGRASVFWFGPSVLRLLSSGLRRPVVGDRVEWRRLAHALALVVNDDARGRALAFEADLAEKGVKPNLLMLT